MKPIEPNEPGLNWFSFVNSKLTLKVSVGSTRFIQQTTEELD